MVGSRSSLLGRAALLGFILTVMPLSASADTHTCNGVDKKAVLGISSSASVNVSSQDKVCSFAVDGVSPSGSQSASFANAMNQLLAGNISSNNMTDDLLASLVLGPFISERPDSSLMGRFRNSFGSGIRDIGDCIASFRRDPASSSGQQVNRTGLICRVVQARANNSLGRDDESFGPIQIQLNQPALQIGLILNDQAFVLVIPARLIVAGLNGFRLGR